MEEIWYFSKESTLLAKLHLIVQVPYEDPEYFDDEELELLGGRDNIMRLRKNLACTFILLSTDGYTFMKLTWTAIDGDYDDILGLNFEEEEDVRNSRPY